MPIEADDRTRLLALIDKMNSAKTVSPAEAERKFRKDMDDAMERLKLGEVLTQSPKSLEFLSLPDGDFKEHIHKLDSDLAANVTIVSETFDHFYQVGTLPPPYYPWRIAVILRKAKETELEASFLRAWCRHFPTGNGKRYGDLVERARKIGIAV